MESPRQEEETVPPPRKKQHLSAAHLAESDKALARKADVGLVSGSSLTGTSSSSSGRGTSSGDSNNGSVEGSSSSPESDYGGSEQSGPAPVTSSVRAPATKKGPHQHTSPPTISTNVSETASKKRSHTEASAEAPKSSGNPPVIYRADGKKHVEKNSLTEEALIEAKLRAKNINKDKVCMTEDEKRDERRAANRLSAFQSRQRRKIVIEDLQKTVASLSKDNASQRQELVRAFHNWLPSFAFRSILHFSLFGSDLT